jgi:hypothetical protein
VDSVKKLIIVARHVKSKTGDCINKFVEEKPKLEEN